MLGMFKKKANKAVGEVKRFEKRDLMQACVGIALLTGYADGELEASEAEKIQKVLATNEALAGFGPELTDTFNRYNALLKDGGLIMGRVKILREIEDVKGDRQEAEDVFVTGITVALADGEMEDAERKVLEDIGNRLGLRLADYFEA